ncbi:hypothetical protein ACIQOV_00520 [Kitasatospora sp. NPDC091257]|uniref:hypothetical protein n=1 Tax=Kitasatospora sp. NPDC091257 TaxID=3364084 RepID=UPI00382719A4
MLLTAGRARGDSAPGVRVATQRRVSAMDGVSPTPHQSPSLGGADRGRVHLPARTYHQEPVFVELAGLTPVVAGYDTASALGSPDGGTRPAAYARLYARPEEEFLPALVEAALPEGLAFNQYWAYHAIGSTVDAVGPGNVRLDTVRLCVRACP